MLRKDIIAALARTPAQALRHIDPPRRRSAVAAIVDRNGALLLTKRTERADDPWSGHLSFPGGRMEDNDADPLAAALRETEEEIGLSLARESLIGGLDELAAVGGAPGMVIHPYVFWDDALDIGTLASEFRSNAEVASILAWPIETLLAGEGRSTMLWVRGDQRLTLPCVDLDGHRLWGLTLRMVDDLLDRLRRSRDSG